MNWMKEIREQKGLTQYELGRLIGKYQSRIWQIENDYCTPKEWEKEDIAYVLGLSVDEIFPEK